MRVAATARWTDITAFNAAQRGRISFMAPTRARVSPWVVDPAIEIGDGAAIGEWSPAYS